MKWWILKIKCSLLIINTIMLTNCIMHDCPPVHPSQGSFLLLFQSVYPIAMGVGQDTAVMGRGGAGGDSRHQSGPAITLEAFGKSKGKPLTVAEVRQWGSHSSVSSLWSETESGAPTGERAGLLRQRHRTGIGQVRALCSLSWSQTVWNSKGSVGLIKLLGIGTRDRTLDDPLNRDFREHMWTFLGLRTMRKIFFSIK